MPIHKSNRQLMEKKAHQKIQTRAGYGLDHYAEIMADAFASALEDGWTPAEIRTATFEKLNEWGVDYDI